MKLFIIFFIPLLFSCSTANKDARPESTQVNPIDNVLPIEKIQYGNIIIEPSDDDEILIREYNYNSGEDDSRNSSRKNAIQQIKILVSEEIGTHIESYLEIETIVRNGIDYQIVKKEINNLSAGITKIKILEENWNGKQYYVKVKISINYVQAISLLHEAIKAKSNKNNILALTKSLESQQLEISNYNMIIKDLQDKLDKQEIIINSTNKGVNIEPVTNSVKQQSNKKKNLSFNRSKVKSAKEYNPILKRELRCLTKNVYFMAKNERTAAQLAIAMLTINRVKSDNFPTSICSVVWQSKQFYWTYDGKSDTPSDRDAWKRAKQVAKFIYAKYDTLQMRSNGALDITRGALYYYHAKNKSPKIPLKSQVTRQIGELVFYN